MARRKLSLQGRRIDLKGVWSEIVNEEMVTDLTKQSGVEDELPGEVADEQHSLKDEEAEDTEDAKQ